MCKKYKSRQTRVPRILQENWYFYVLGIEYAAYFAAQQLLPTDSKYPLHRGDFFSWYHSVYNCIQDVCGRKNCLIESGDNKDYVAMPQ